MAEEFLEHVSGLHGIEEEEEIYICSSRLGLMKMEHRHSGNGRNSQQRTARIEG
jgi:hypothetical protein